MPFQKGHKINLGRKMVTKDKTTDESGIDLKDHKEKSMMDLMDAAEVTARELMSCTDPKLRLMGIKEAQIIHEKKAVDTDSKMSSTTRDIITFITQMMVANEKNCPDLIEIMNIKCLVCKELRGSD